MTSVLRRLACITCLVLAPTVSALAQESPKIPQFDVISVKPNKSGDNRIRIMMGDDYFQMDNVTLTMVVQNAFGLKPSQVTGLPSWSNTDHFDIRGKVLETDKDLLKKLTPEQRRPMYQAMLKERFGLAYHMETRNMPVYELVVDKGGSKLKALAPQTDADKEEERKAGAALSAGKSGPTPFMGRGSMMNRRTPEGFELQANGVKMAGLAGMLSNSAGRNVIDKTGLTGEYTFQLRWAPEDGPGAAGQRPDTAAEALPSIFTAVQEQLGLRMVATKGDVEMLVVDHVDHPAEN